MLEQLIDFLSSELEISAEAITLAKKAEPPQPHTLPITLWRYGLLNNKQLDLVFDWLEVS